ncbi:MAG: TetR/AcrR family transcriptional regulator C-terminal domain-containing protein [Ardenticatenaceae bacterium]|nr:TetR/AcrR family transcriptional regulator C-terminal domain-containing protein [Ardenticatenaceae bacterium]HBY99235.1 TetR family transcriptional regulator [Chloroflexota bacterium]
MSTNTAPGQTQPRAQRPRLDRRQVLETALALVDAEGLQALSMRRLGAALGIDAMAIYGYVHGKDALLDGLVELLWAETSAPAGASGPWTERLRGFVRAIRALFHRHPHAAPLLLRPNVLPESVLTAFDRYLEMLRDAGFAEPRAAEILRTLVAYGIGYGVMELSCYSLTGLQEYDPLSQRERLVRLGQLLPRGIAPRLTQVAMTMCVECEPEADFEFGLDLLLQGLERFQSGRDADQGAPAAREATTRGED